MSTWAPATNDGQHFAGRFTILDPYRITGVFTSYFPIFPSGDSFDLRIYENSPGGTVPVGGASVDQYIYKSSVIVPTSDGWWGEEGLAWDLSAGTYWLGMIAQTGNFNTHAPVIPMEAYAGIWNGYEWQPTSGYAGEFAARIEGVIIPEPATPMLLLIALPVVLLKRRRAD